MGNDVSVGEGLEVGGKGRGVVVDAAAAPRAKVPVQVETRR